MKNLLVHFMRKDDGQDLVEYAFLIVFIALVAVVGLNLLGVGLNTFYANIAGAVSGVGPPTPPPPGS